MPASEVVIEGEIGDNDIRSFQVSVAEAVTEGGSFGLGIYASQPLTLAYWFEDVSTENGVDYSGPSGTIDVYGGGSGQVVFFETLDDGTHEPRESFKLHVQIAGYPASEVVLEGDILDNDEPAVAQVVGYRYDYKNRLIGRVADADGDGPVEATVQKWVYDGDQKLLEFDGEGNVTHRLLWGPNVDQIYADEEALNDIVHWALTDQQNTVRGIAVFEDAGTPVATDDTTTLVESRSYDPFGLVLTPWGVDVSFGFQGKFYDDLTRSTEHINRWLDSWLRQWYNLDPDGFSAGDPNLARFVHNDPVNYVDPDGLEEQNNALAENGPSSDDPPWQPYNGSPNVQHSPFWSFVDSLLVSASQARWKANKAMNTMESGIYYLVVSPEARAIAPF